MKIHIILLLLLPVAIIGLALLTVANFWRYDAVGENSMIKEMSEQQEISLAQSSRTSGISVGNKNFNITYSAIESDLGTDFKYTPQCFIDCFSSVNFTYDGDLAPSSISLNSRNISWILNKVNPNDVINITGMKLLVNQTYNISILNSICSDAVVVINATTNGTSQSCNTTSTIEPRWKFEWIDLPSSITLKKGEWYAIGFTIKRKAQLGSFSTDFMPSIYGLQLNKLQWLNTSFINKRLITVTNPNKVQVNLTLTYNTHYKNSDCSDIRFSNSSENEELDYWTEDVNTSRCVAWVELRQSDNFYIYYNNNTPVVTTSNGNNTFPVFDDMQNYSELDNSTWVNIGMDSGLDVCSSGVRDWNFNSNTTPSASIIRPGNGLNGMNITDTRKDTVSSYVTVLQKSGKNVTQPIELRYKMQTQNKVATYLGDWGLRNATRQVGYGFTAYNDFSVDATGYGGCPNSFGKVDLNRNYTFSTKYNATNTSVVIYNNDLTVNITNRTSNTVTAGAIYFSSITADTPSTKWTRQTLYWIFVRNSTTPEPTLSIGTEQSYTPTDSCTYSSGNWNIDCSDNCNITSDANLGSNSLIFSNAGTFTLSATVNCKTKVLSAGCAIVYNKGAMMTC